MRSMGVDGLGGGLPQREGEEFENENQEISRRKSGSDWYYELLNMHGRLLTKACQSCAIYVQNENRESQKAKTPNPPLSTQRLPPNYQIHRREQLFSTSLDETICRQSQTVGCFLCSFGYHTDGFSHPNESVHQPATPPCHPRDGENISQAATILELAGQRVVPGCCVFSFR